AARSWTPTRPTCSSWDTRTWRPCGPRKRDRSTSIPRCGRSGSPCWNGRAWSMGSRVGCAGSTGRSSGCGPARGWFAATRAGRLSLSLEPVLVPEIVKETVELAAPLAAGAAVQLRAEVADFPQRHVMADKQRVVQILLNLVSNAIKYNRRGGTVTLSCEDVAGGRFRITVRDTGPGIPPENLGRLFTPFERLNADTTSVEGSGLGLVLSKGLVEAMGGVMGVDSVVGQGSTFWAEFPVADGTIPPEEPADREPPGTDAAGVPSKQRTVLYVEDNLSNFTLIERLPALRPALT